MQQSACTSAPINGRTVTVDDLPTEMLWKVFSYLELKELVSACCVSSRWKEVGNGVPLMTSHEYRITPYESPEQIARTFQSIPDLRNVRIFTSPIIHVESALLSLLEFCTDVREIDISYKIQIGPNLLQDVVKKFPNLKSIIFPLRPGAQQLINQIGACLELQKLVIKFESDIDLKPIADGCPNLRHLNIHGIRHKSDDLIYLLRRKKHLLQSLYFTSWLYPPKTVLPLSECTRLEFIGCDIIPSKLPLGVFLDEISSLSKLKRLDLFLYGPITQDEVMKLSKCSFSSTLTELTLYVVHQVNQDFARTIVSCLPNVETLRGSSDGNAATYQTEWLQILLEMKKLQRLGLRNLAICGPLFEKLLQCKQIKHLVIANCCGFGDEEALRLVEEIKPTFLKLTHCVDLSDGFLKKFPRCETLKELYVYLEKPLEQTVRELKLRQPSTRIIVRKLRDVGHEPYYLDAI